MEKEIHLRELVDILLKGRRFILAFTVAAATLGALFGFFIYTPVYQAGSFVDVMPYRVAPFQFDSMNFAGKGQTQTFLEKCLIRGEQEGLPATAFDGIQLLEVRNSTLVEIRVSHQDFAVAERAARIAGEELLNMAHRQRLEELQRQEEATRKALRIMDEEIAAFKAAYGEQPLVEGQEEPYLRLLEARGKLIYDLGIVAGQHEEMRENPVPHASPWLHDGIVALPRVAAYRLVFIAAALLLGLIISAFLVFVKHFWSAGSPE